MPDGTQEVAAPQVEVAQQSETETPQSVSESTARTDTAETVAETDEQKNHAAQQEERQRTEKRARGVQKRIDELTRDKHEERAARQALEKQNAELMALVRGNKPGAADQGDGEPTREQFSDDLAYVEARARYHARAEAKALMERNSQAQTEAQKRHAQQQNEQTVTNAYVARQREVAKTIPDFDQTMADGADDITVPDHVFHMIRRMPEGPLVAYHMVKNPALTDQFYSHPPELHGILLGQLSATLKGAAKVSNAPPPGKPVQAKTGSSSESPPEDPDAYMEWAAKHMKG